MVVLVIRAEEEDATRKENLRLRPYKRQQQRSEKMRFYHAAPKETMMKIYAEGILNRDKYRSDTKTLSAAVSSMLLKEIYGGTAE